MWSERYYVDSEEFSLKERRGSTEVRYRGGRECVCVCGGGGGGDWLCTHKSVTNVYNHHSLF